MLLDGNQKILWIYTIENAGFYHIHENVRNFSPGLIAEKISIFSIQNCAFDQSLGVVVRKRNAWDSQKQCQGGKPAYLTAFKHETVKAMIEEYNGEILHMSIIPTKTDEGNKINVIGLIFKKK